jgi:hypothetical protein
LQFINLCSYRTIHHTIVKHSILSVNLNKLNITLRILTRNDEKPQNIYLHKK